MFHTFIKHRFHFLCFFSSPFTTYFISKYARTWNNTPNSLHSQRPGILEFHNNHSCLTIIIFSFLFAISASYISSFLSNRNVFTPRYVFSYTTAIVWPSTIHCLSIDVVCILTRTTILFHLTFLLHHLHFTHFYFSKHHSITFPIFTQSQLLSMSSTDIHSSTPGSQTNFFTRQLGRRSFMKM